MASGGVLRAEKLARCYGERWVFRDLSFSLSTGEALAVTGPNGAGKSTLLKLAAGLLRPSAGSLQWPQAPAGRAVCGLCAPDAPLYADLTATETLGFFAALAGRVVPPRESAGALARVGLAGRGDDLVNSLSSGQRWRLQLLVALLPQPLVLLLDEPSAHLDAAGRDILSALLREHLAAGGMALLATNDPRDRDLCSGELPVTSPGGLR